MAGMFAAPGGAPASAGGGFSVPNVAWPGTDVGSVFSPVDIPTIGGSVDTSGTPGSGVGKYATQLPKSTVPRSSPTSGADTGAKPVVTAQAPSANSVIEIPERNQSFQAGTLGEPKISPLPPESWTTDDWANWDKYRRMQGLPIYAD